MLFAVIYTARDVTEERQARALKLFTNWKPPAGYEFKAHYTFVDGSGGLGLAEVDSAAALLEANAPWGPFFTFKVVPVVEITESMPIAQKVQSWRDSVK